MPNLWILIFTYLAVVNITAYFLMYKDKQHAIKQKWRVAERQLIMLSILGGFVGIHWGMQRFHHKTMDFMFKSAVSFGGVLWIVIIPLSVLR